MVERGVSTYVEHAQDTIGLPDIWAKNWFPCSYCHSLLGVNLWQRSKCPSRVSTSMILVFWCSGIKCYIIVVSQTQTSVEAWQVHKQCKHSLYACKSHLVHPLCVSFLASGAGAPTHRCIHALVWQECIFKWCATYLVHQWPWLFSVNEFDVGTSNCPQYTIVNNLLPW